nr:MAG TPA: hypothetical protein [Caudoviricetes sp.]DAW63388.1 MAG TPA: hypothetical protein [Caudoviricetes sp.]
MDDRRVRSTGGMVSHPSLFLIRQIMRRIIRA